MARCERVFEYVENVVNNNGIHSGWRLRESPHFDPMAVPYGVVHDALEHHTPGEDGIENEMMAFGAIYHIRANGGWWNQFGTNVNVDKMMAWDIARFLHDRAFNILPCDETITKELNRFLVESFPLYLDRLESFHGITPGSPDYVKAMVAFYNAGAWLSKGYTRARKRWHDNSSMSLTGLFNTITDKVASVFGKCGDVLKIQFDTKTLWCDVEHISYM